ncbi:peptidoglycan glycosyltransferase [Longilinea arvoryzae]|uniref:Peptidoglycan glycosyltransferase n=1 Tax=Longilinea arvoryzae TaxID=360412 RepID=A0A0S7BLL4_9CHLR|nr:penicillin-binding protein 2 [Longilinea arvoryzae]GAP14875.1 peptidoglycan glycosyltransferase [Longilinea arvoryzae]
MNTQKESPKGFFESWRYMFIYGLMALVFGFFLYRLFTLQIINGNVYAAQADENRTTDISVATSRGLIYDRNGYILAQNVPSYNVVITPANLPEDDGTVQNIYRQVSDLIGVPVSQGNTDEETVRNFSPCQNDLGITQIVYIGRTNAPYDPVRVKCNVDSNTAMIIRERAEDWPGVGIEIEAVRDYPTGNLTAEVIGFLGPIPASRKDELEATGFVANRDKVGYAGVELSMDDQLVGKNGKRVIEVDVGGQEIRDLQTPVEPTPGNNITLTIDTRLQLAARTALIEQINKWNKKFGYIKYPSGVVIAMNPKTGEILAMVSYPNYENNRMARLIPSYYYQQLIEDPNKPLLNHAISAEMAPGSVFKLGTAIGILNEGVVTPEQQIEDPGRITITEKYSENDTGRNRDYVCYTYKTTGKGHGMVNFLRGVALSCDVYFYKVGGGYQNEVKEGLNIWRIGEYSRALGYGQTLGIELPGEADGLIPDPNWKRINQGENWSTGDTYIATIGQGYVLATPLQVLTSAATIANDGKLMRPTIIHDITDANGTVVKTFTPEMLWDLTKDPKIQVYDENYQTTGEKKTVQPWVIEMTQEGMREVVVDGTATTVFDGFDVPSAGKTGTAEYCDNVAQAKNLCISGSWPAHAWYVGYAPYNDPEIAVVAFVYNGDEGSTVAAPIVRQVMEAYFELKSGESTTTTTTTP